jgi:hypothetical protein
MDNFFILSGLPFIFGTYILTYSLLLTQNFTCQQKLNNYANFFYLSASACWVPGL